MNSWLSTYESDDSVLRLNSHLASCLCFIFACRVPRLHRTLHLAEKPKTTWVSSTIAMTCPTGHSPLPFKQAVPTRSDDPKLHDLKVTSAQQRCCPSRSVRHFVSCVVSLTEAGGRGNVTIVVHLSGQTNKDQIILFTVISGRSMCIFDRGPRDSTVHRRWSRWSSRLGCYYWAKSRIIDLGIQWISISAPISS